MISKKMQPLMANNSAIRTMFEEGDIMKKKYGEHCHRTDAVDAGSVGAAGDCEKTIVHEHVPISNHSCQA